ncbi:MAG: DUF302 domain-containing protein [Rhodothermales bacterium]|nr:DUF302 domain-containing protein [Rhodothermales bacterium]
MYYFSKTLSQSVESTEEVVRQALQAHGFGVLTEIDVAATFKKKLDIDFPQYKILGACNPGLAHEALNAESKIGTMLPCNVIVREIDAGTTEVAAVDPIASMQAVENPSLNAVAAKVREQLKQVIESL